ncbi:MAG TPA: hypothetical protein VEW03_02490, partial [Longimicrobiaceae bacterium]|nr:hypothetical protein [Longimicrobiaceae bacterium]
MAQEGGGARGRPRSRFGLRVPPSAPVRAAVGAAAVALLVGLWFLLTSGAAEERVISPSLLPSPAEVARSLPMLVTDRNLAGSILATL